MRRMLMIFVVGLLVCPSAWADQETSFEVILAHYEPIRLALISDSTEGVNTEGAAIAKELGSLQADFSQGRSGATVEGAVIVKELLPIMIEAADALAKSDSLESSRAAFYELSKPLVRWREALNQGDRPSVAYCSMHKKSWLQPGEKIGNPYGDMPRCGRIVSE